jgi:hypothetical protein
MTTKKPASAHKWLFPTRIAAEGAVRLIERLSPALEHVDNSSGAIGTAVNRAIEALVRDSPCDPKTLTRAARDHAEREPAFAEVAGLAALRWLLLGFGYEITALDVWSAYHAALKTAEALGHAEETKAIIRNWVAAERPDGFVRQVLGRELGLS